MHRRTFLTAVGATATVATAGCLGGNGDTDDPESVIEEYYDIIAEMDSPEAVEAGIGDLEDISHSLSPLPEFIGDAADGDEEDFEEMTIESLEIEMVDENLSAEEIEENADGIGFFLDEEEVAEVADAENAFLEAEVAATTDGETEEANDQWLVAQEDGDWLIVL